MQKNESPTPSGASLTKRVLKGLVMGVAAMILIGLGIGMLLPSSYVVQRTIVIKSPSAPIYEQVARLRSWPDWSTWTTTNYPRLQYQYDGAESGTGAKSSWTDPDNGNGKLEIVSSNPETGIEYEMLFEGFVNPMYGSIRLDAAEDNATMVVWTARGDVGRDPVSRYFVMMFDSMIGADFETGLKQLKQKIEANTQDDSSE